jgi:peptide/nickel transport system ATP-binding protein
MNSTHNMSPVLAIKNLKIELPAWSDRPLAVDDVSLTLAQGEILCVVGESGSGKSMLGKSLMGLLPKPHVSITGGQIDFQGQNITQLDEDDWRKLRGQHIAMIFQEPMTALSPLMRIGQQIEEVMMVHTSMSPSQRRDLTMQLLNDVHLPDPDRVYSSYPHQLSGGQRQRVVIAMALALEPKLIIADEPTTALDVTTQAQILHLIKELQKKHGTAVLFITHDFGVVAEIADRVAVMQHGKLVEVGVAEQVLNAPTTAYSRQLIEAVPSLTPRIIEQTLTAQEPLLVVNSVSKTYAGQKSWFSPSKGGVKAVQNVSLKLPKQGSLAIVGESGSGKSTLARCIIGLEHNESGEINLEGQIINGMPRRELRPIRKKIQMIFQDPFSSLNPRQKVGEIISLGPMIQGVARDVAWEEARELLRRVGLRAEAADRYPHEFSGGQRQRIGIARALAVKPKLIVADEPVSALDVSVQKQVLELLDELREEMGLSLLFITHDLRVAATVCENILIMSKGEVVEQGTTAAVFENPSHPYTKSLLAAIPGQAWSRSMAIKA